MQIKTEHNDSDDEWQMVSPGLVAGEYTAGMPEQRVRLWALVLDARSIPCHIEQCDSGLRLLVPMDKLATACRELQLFEEENHDWPPPAPRSHTMVKNTLATLSVLLLLAIFHNLIQFGLTLPGGYTPDWIAMGSSQAVEIRNGQWWRLVTALTLHADWIHLSGNLFIGGIFVIFLCSELGSGLAWSLMLGSGILGNLANAWVQSPDHNSVGASTAVFGTVGILAAISLVRNRWQRQRRWPLPVAAALALLALLGTEGKNSDIGAHLFGFAFGIGLGIVTEYLLEKFGRPGRVVNALLALASAAVVVVAWWAAVVAGGLG